MRIALLSYWVIGLPVGLLAGLRMVFPTHGGLWVLGWFSGGRRLAAILLSLRLHHVSRNKELILRLTR